jgi:hypothetical protein
VLKNPIQMKPNVLSRLAHEGKYPFCQSCGVAIVSDMWVHRRKGERNGKNTINYFCDECERTGRMYAVGTGKEDE